MHSRRIFPDYAIIRLHPKTEVEKNFFIDTIDLDFVHISKIWIANASYQEMILSESIFEKVK